MKKIYLAILFLASFQAISQKIDYDHSSKWFFGLNAGGTWQTTDVKTQTGGAWGFLLGKSYNYNYGKPFSFDIRGRYLTGNWYGQDVNSSSLSGLNSNNALFNYQNYKGYTYHNFKSNVHRLALELSIHLNALTQRTGVDPYIFGGIGLTWNKTYANLTDSSDIFSSPTLYDYQTNGLNSVKFDQSYESILDGYSLNRYKVNFMPSLGFGLGYMVGKRTTLGLEHKTTFTLKDNFDGLSTESPRMEKDLYHYTSVYLKFRFRTGYEESNIINGTTGGGTNTNSFTNCNAPRISLTTKNNQTVNAANFKIEAKISDIGINNQVLFYDGNNAPINFTFNTNTQNFESSVFLKPGLNTFTIKAENNCGNDTKTITVNYTDCVMPSGNFTNPNSSNLTVQNPNFVLSAILKGIQSTSNIIVYQNGTIIQSPSFNLNTGTIQTNVVLQPGTNIFKIDFSNNCGNGSISTTVIYNDCFVPSIQFTTPSAAGSTVNTATFKASAKIVNYNASSKVSVMFNGVNISNFTVANGQIEIPLTLVRGNNNLTLNVTNSCGTDVESTSIIYQACDAPIISITAPTSNLTVSNSVILLKAKVENISSKQAVQVLLNNVSVTNFTYNPTTKFIEANLNLSAGNNSITVSSNNTCGSDIETNLVVYDACKTPVVSFLSSNSTVTNSAFNLSATVQNMTSTKGLILTQNGQQINFSFLNGNLTSAVSLVPGLNTFVLNASRTCGVGTKTLVINYNNCVAPIVNLLNPAAPGITVNNGLYEFKALVSNCNSAQEITVKLNGLIVPFTFINGVVESKVNLINGINNFSIEVKNACGSDIKSTSINLVTCTPPKITISQPVNDLTVTNSGFNLQATLVGVTNSNGISIKQNGVSKTFTFVNGQLNAILSLLPGTNNVLISVQNDCGNDVKSCVINYDNCIPPAITITSPIQFTSTTTDSQFNIQAKITNSTPQGISVSQNGTNVNFQFSNETLTSTLTLQPGNNTIAISTLNNCGNDVEFINVTYNNCISPIVNIDAPAISGNAVNSTAYAFKASVQNLNSLQGIVLTLNGTIIQNPTWNNGVITANVNLIPGLNTFSITASNSCGRDSKVSTVIYNECKSPVVTILSPSIGTQTVTTSQFNFVANALNVSNIQDVTLTLNGLSLTNVNLINGQISANVVLKSGINSFYISTKNECGNDAKSVELNYEPCNVPVVSVAAANNQTVINSNYTFKANIQHLVSNQGIVLTLNGNVISGLTFDNGQITAQVNLTPGKNTFSVSATNACGSDAEILDVIYEHCVSPLVKFNTNFASGSTTMLETFPLLAEIVNFNNSTTVSVQLNGVQLNNYNYTNGIISQTINLPAGTSTFEISANNACGSDTKTFTITRCESAKIELINPTSEASSINKSLTAVVFKLTNVANASEITISQNGTILNNFVYLMPYYKGQANLVNGKNTFTISVNNACNQLSKTITIDYNPGIENNSGGTNNPNPTGNNTNSNNGHGNNSDGVDSSNPGKGSGGPNGQTDTNGGVDDENGTPNNNTNSGNSSPRIGSGTKPNTTTSKPESNPKPTNTNNSGVKIQNSTKSENTNTNNKPSSNPTPSVNVNKPENTNKNIQNKSEENTTPSPIKQGNETKGKGGGK